MRPSAERIFKDKILSAAGLLSFRFAQPQMRPSGIEPDSVRWQRTVLTDILWSLMSLIGAEII